MSEANSDSVIQSTKDFLLEWFWIGIPLGILVLLVFAYPAGFAEDAYIILRYVRNIREGYGFVWNPGEDPVWGSTSLLWTLLLASLGFVDDLILLARVLSLILAVGIILLIAGFGRMHFRASRISCCIAVSTFSATTVVGHIQTGFDVLLFSFLMLAAFMVSLLVVKRRESNSQYAALLVSVLALLSITRPEGLVLSGLTLFLVLLLSERNAAKDCIVQIALPTISIIGMMYLAIFLYFGSVLPNTFLIKASTPTFSIYEISGSITYISRGIGPLAIFAVLLWMKELEFSRSLKILLLLLPTASYVVMYWFIHQTQNILGRFQFPVAPILFALFAMALDMVVGSQGSSFRKSLAFPPLSKKHLWSFMLGMAIFSYCIGIQILDTSMRLPYAEGDDKTQVALILQDYSMHDYTILVSEAGMIPYYSQWRVIDAGGLNDPFIATHGLLEAYLETHNPEMVQFHDYFSENSTDWATTDNYWQQMTYKLYSYCSSHRYTLACINIYHVVKGGTVFHSGFQWYWVRDDFAHSVEIALRISSLPTLDYVYQYSMESSE